MNTSEREFASALRVQAEQPPAGDPYVRAFADAFHDIIQDEDKKRLFKPLEYRMSGPKSANLALRAMQKQLLPRRHQAYMLDRYPSTIPEVDSFMNQESVADAFVGCDEYPFGFEDPDKWKYAFDLILRDSNAQSDFYYDLAARKVQSNIAERYKGLKLALLAYEDRFGDAPRVLDIGCSQNQGLKQLALSAFDDDFAFHAPVAGYELRLTDKNNELVTDTDLTDRLQALLSEEMFIGHSLGVDFFSIKDFLTEQWIRSCSFRPAELLDNDRLEHFNLLCSAEPPNVHFARADFATENPECHAFDPPRGQYDVVSFFTILHQLKVDEQAEVFRNARQYLRPNGIMVIQDFYSSLSGPFEYTMPEDIYEAPFIYRTLVVDMADHIPKLRTMPKSGFQEFLVWDGGRCNEVQIGSSHAAQKITNRLAN